jgi:hypothetical protein
VKRLIFLTTVSLAVAFPGLASSASPPITVVAPSSLTVQAGQPKPTTVTVRNDGADDITLSLEAVLGKGTAHVKPSRLKVKGLGVKPFQLTVTPDKSTRDTSGGITFTATAGGDAPPAVLPVVIKPEEHHDNAATFLLFAPLVFAVLLVELRVFTIRNRKPTLGPANWSFSDSWATSLTLVGALLGTILGAGVLPDELDLFSKAGYSAFNVLFGMLVLVAPLVYAAAQNRIKNKDDGTPQYQGKTWAFAIASVVTLWGVLGELITVGLLLREIGKAGGLSTVLVVLAWGILVAIIGTAVVYTWRRMGSILRPPPGTPETEALGAPVAPAEPWSLL